VLPEAVSYYDGFFVSPTQILARATTSAGKGVTTAFNAGQKLDAYTVFEDIAQIKPDVEREMVISGGFLDNLASPDDAKAFMYVFEGIGFPNAPLLQPRLGSVEEWKFLNNNNDEHPIHIHVNDFQVTHYLDPTRVLRPDLRCGPSTTPTCRRRQWARKSPSSSKARSACA
jgi:FtsP/CotA-like multicopper oxidase with cupredoxin domain